MKKILIITFAILLSSLTVFGQFFEGKIIYTTSFTSQNPQVTAEQWKLMMGSKFEYSIKGENYKSVMNGTLMQWQLYRNQENKVYSKMSNSETALWVDASVNDNPVISFEINKGVIEILGYQCDELILECKNGVEKYYFSPELGVDISLFEKHKFGNWYEFLKHSKSLSLKSSVEDKTFLFTMEIVATEVKEMKFKNSYFDLPEGIKTQKAPE
jgi:hypothetical protein